jgi:hypothetical protein
MREDADDWAHFWDGKTEQWLEGYCFAKGTIWFDQDSGKIVQHVHGRDIVYTWPEPGDGE